MDIYHVVYCMTVIKWNCLAGLPKRTIKFVRIGANYLMVQRVKNGMYGLMETFLLCPLMHMGKGSLIAEE